MAVSVGRKSVADRTKTLKVGDAAPDFELAGHRDASEKFKLSSMRMFGKEGVHGRDGFIRVQPVVKVRHNGLYRCCSFLQRANVWDKTVLER